MSDRGVKFAVIRKTGYVSPYVARAVWKASNRPRDFGNPAVPIVARVVISLRVRSLWVNLTPWRKPPVPRSQWHGYPLY